MRIPNPFAMVGKALARAAAAASGKVGGVWPRIGGEGWGWIRSLLPGASFDWEQEAGDPWMNSVVALAIAWIGARVARPRLKVMRLDADGNKVEVPDHGILSLWRRPNPEYGRREMEKAIALSLTVDGNAYVYKVRNYLGQVVQLWWIPHFRIKPLWPSDGSEFVGGYRLSIDGRLFDIPREDIIHFRDGIDPRNERSGLSALRASLREVCTVNYESGFTAALLKNSGVPSVTLVPDDNTPGQPLTEPDRDRAVARWKSAVSGDNAGDPIIFGSKWKVVPVGFSPEQLRLDRLPKMAQARVAASTGIANMSLGLPDESKTYANLGEANRTSWGAIVAMQELIAEKLCDDLVTEAIWIAGKLTPASGPLDLILEYDYSQIQELQESLDALHKRVRDDFIANLVRRARAQQKLGYEPDPEEVEAGGPYASEIAAAANPADPEEEDDQVDDQDAEDNAADGDPDEAKGLKWRY